MSASATRMTKSEPQPRAKPSNGDRPAQPDLAALGWGGEGATPDEAAAYLERQAAGRSTRQSRTLDKSRAAELRAQGATYAAIGRELGFSGSAVRYALDETARSKKLEANRRYNASPAGQAAQACYNESPRGRARDDRYYYSRGCLVQFKYALKRRLEVNKQRLAEW